MSYPVITAGLKQRCSSLERDEYLFLAFSIEEKKEWGERGEVWPC
jgi:hypothetical protein